MASLSYDLQSRIDAYSGTDPDSDIPTIWTPEHVGARMIEAFEVLAKIPERVGPASPANAWPAYMHEFHELIGVQVEGNRARVRATSAELSRMNAAFMWPVAFLTDMPLQADALSLWAFCKAGDRSIAEILARRMKQARKVAKRMTELENQRRAVKRRGIARNVAAWANSRLEQADTPEQKQNIKANAHIRMERAVRENNCLPVEYGPRDAVSGTILTRRSLDKYRHLAAAEISLRLHERGAVVR